MFLFFFQRITLVLLFVNSYSLFGQGEHFVSGARSKGIGDASVTLTDIFSVNNNIACLSVTNSLSIAGGFENKFGLPSLNSTTLIIALPLKKYSIGLSLQRFGDKYYNEQKAGLGISHKIEKVSLGLKVNWVQFNGAESFNRKSFVIELGGLIEVTNNLFFAAHATNINQGSIKTSNEKIFLPVILKAGVKYVPFTTTSLFLEVYKNILIPTFIKTGIEYIPVPCFFLRTGYEASIQQLSFGTGFRKSSFEFNYTISGHSSLGLSHQCSLFYRTSKVYL